MYQFGERRRLQLIHSHGANSATATLRAALGGPKKQPRPKSECALQPAPPKLQLRATLWAGLLSGLVWNLGNLCSILAIEFARVPFGVAYPILQSALVVAGLIGIFVLGEITQPGAIAVFFLSAFVVLGGAVLLSVFGPQSS